MNWGAIWAAITGFLTACLPYVRDFAVFVAGKEFQKGLDARNSLKEVRKANEVSSAHAADSTADELRYLASTKRLRD